MSAVIEVVSIDAPVQLVAETRVDFRAAAMEGLERSVEANARYLRINMSGTVAVDASGLGTLVVVQKRARERGLATLLVGPHASVRTLLAATKLAPLFEFAS